MFKDKREELERLEAQLRLEEEQEALEEAYHEEFDDITEEDYDGFEEEEEDLDQFEEEVTQLYRNYSNRYGQVRGYNTDDSDIDLDEYSEEVRQPKKRSDILVLSAIAMALLAGIFAVLAWWAVRLLG